MKIAVLVLSRDGLDMARRLRDSRSDETAIFGPSCVVGSCFGAVEDESRAFAVPVEGAFPTGEGAVFGWLGPLRLFFPSVWDHFDGVVAIMALGIVVRMVGPLASDKRRDPAIVVVDDAGRFAISVLGGHVAGANLLAEQVAGTLGAALVVTTASESRRLPALDEIGRDLGWIIERPENLTRAAASVVRGEVVAVWQDAGSPDWWRRFGPWPDHFVRLSSLRELLALKPSALLIISDRIITDSVVDGRTVVYRPPSLVAGIGCRRGTSREVIDDWIGRIFREQGLAESSLAALATATLKMDEPGLLDCARSRGLPLVAFPVGQLSEQPGIENPSERVRSKIGIAAVAEPAALRAAGSGRLLVTKQIGPGLTLAVARRSYQPEYTFDGPKPGA